jgi:hypothetical protein
MFQNLRHRIIFRNIQPPHPTPQVGYTSLRQSSHNLLELLECIFRHGNLYHGGPFQTIGGCNLGVRIVPACNGDDDVDNLIPG